MAAQRSVGRFCSVVTADLASLALMDAANLGVGAQVFVLSNFRSYRLSAAVLAAASPMLIAPAGGGGTWIQENAVNDQTLFVYALSRGPDVPSTTNTWTAFPSGVGVYTVDTAKALWSVNSSSGIATYNGPTARFMMQANISFFSIINPDESWEFSLTRNGALLGTTTADPLAVRVDANGFNEGYGAVLTSWTIVPSGTSYQAVFRNLQSGGTFRMLNFQMCFQLLPG